MDDDFESDEVWSDPVSSRASAFKDLMIATVGIDDADLRQRSLAMLDALVASVKGKRTGELHALKSERKG